jgi:hypothetical protein
MSDAQPLPPCPHCGKSDRLYTNGRPRGTVRHFYDSYGAWSGMDEENVVDVIQSTTIRCQRCNRIRRDVQWSPDNTDKIVAQEGSHE